MFFLFYISIGMLLFLSKYKLISLTIHKKADEIAKYKPYGAEDLFKATMIVAFTFVAFTWPYWLMKWVNKNRRE